MFPSSGRLPQNPPAAPLQGIKGCMMDFQPHKRWHNSKCHLIPFKPEVNLQVNRDIPVSELDSKDSGTSVK